MTSYVYVYECVSSSQLVSYFSQCFVCFFSRTRTAKCAVTPESDAEINRKLKVVFGVAPLAMINVPNYLTMHVLFQVNGAFRVQDMFLIIVKYETCMR